MNIDFDKLFSDYIEEIKSRNPIAENETEYSKLAFQIKQSAAETCIDILERYEKLKSNDNS